MIVLLCLRTSGPACVDSSLRRVGLGRGGDDEKQVGKRRAPSNAQDLHFGGQQIS